MVHTITGAPSGGPSSGNYSDSSTGSAPARRIAWHLEFARRAGRHRDLEITPASTLSPRDQHALAQSLATFRIGESGTGEHLLAAARDAETTDRYRDALTMFVHEEQEHARLLTLVLDSIENPFRTTHWSDRVFVFLRRIKSLRTEVLTLLVAELVALTYYRALRDGLPEHHDVFDRIYEDEVRHVEFHADTLPTHLQRWNPMTRWVVRLLWNVLVTGTSIVAGLDHRKALRVVDVSVPRFAARVWRDRRELDRRLFVRRT